MQEDPAAWRQAYHDALGLGRTPLDGGTQRHGWKLTKTGAFSAERLLAGSWT